MSLSADTIALLTLILSFTAYVAYMSGRYAKLETTVNMLLEELKDFKQFKEAILKFVHQNEQK